MMRVSEINRTQHVRVRIVGHVGRHGADLLRQSLLSLISHETASVSIDVSCLRYINSAGLVVLAELSTLLTQRGGKLCIVNPTPTINQLLRHCGLDRIMPITADSV